MQNLRRALEEKGQTIVFLANKTTVMGALAVSDQVRPEATHAINRLHDMGIATIMLTGDNVSAATAIGALVGADAVFADLLPEDKLEKIREMQVRYGVVGMLCDAINDAPALAQADIGFAMGAAGSDTTIETADVALMNDDLAKLPAFIAISRATRRILVQNITAALFIKLVFFALALSGMATLWMAVFADVGASLLVVFNGLCLLRHPAANRCQRRHCSVAHRCHRFNRDMVRPVKKFLLILLMVILPVQYTWSAAAVYCQHEKNSPFHFGHHAHQHKVKSEEPHGHGKLKNADADCEYCHFFSHAFFISFDTTPPVAPEITHVEARSMTYTSHIPRRPPRPNWLLVA